jgi:hypothetical protein
MKGLLSLLGAGALALGSLEVSAEEMPEVPEPRVETITTEDGSTDGAEPVEEYDPFSEWFLGSMFIGGTQDLTMPPSTFADRHLVDTWFNVKAKDGRQASIISTNPLDANPEEGRSHITQAGLSTPYLLGETIRVSVGSSGVWDGSSLNLGTRLELLTGPVTPRGGFLIDSEHGQGGYGGVTFNAPIDGDWGNLHGDVDVVGFDGHFDARGFASVILGESAKVYFAVGGRLEDQVVFLDLAALQEKGVSFNYLTQYDVDNHEYHGKLHLAFMGANWGQGNLDFPLHVRSGTGNRVQDNGQGLRVLDGWAPFDSWFAKEGPVLVGNFHLVDGQISGDATLYLLEPLGGRVETFGGVRVGYDGEPSFGGEAHLLVHLDKQLALEFWGNVDYLPGSNQANGIGYMGVLWSLP